MRIAICDDNNLAVLAAQKCIVDNFDTQALTDYRIDTFSSGAELIAAFEAEPYDGVFLDVDMPDISGFDAAGKINSMDLGIPIVFFSNHHDFVYSSFKFRPLWFVCKGSTFEDEMRSAVEALLLVARKRQTSYDFTYKGLLYKLLLKDIFYFHSDRNRIEIIAGDGIYFVVATLDEIQEKVRNHFFARANQSYLINCARISKLWQKDFVTALMMDGNEVQVSKSHRKDFLDVYFNFSVK